MYKNLDQASMFDSIWQFPDDLKKADILGNKIKLSNQYSNINNIVIAGMGGSAIGGDVVSTLENDNINYPIIISRGYSLPNWVNENTLLICSSYSGNTEETLTALDDGLKKKAQIIGITTGGKLANKLTDLKKDVILIPSGLQPRAALAFSFIPMIKFLDKISIIETKLDSWLNDSINALIESRELYSIDSMENPTYELAQQLHKNIPIIYADNSTYGFAALRLKGQLCENAKMLAYHNELPELNQQITQKILNENGVDQFVIEMTGNSFQERFLHMIHYRDWLSFWCAIAHGIDPSPVEKIDRLKKELMKR